MKTVYGKLLLSLFFLNGIAHAISTGDTAPDFSLKNQDGKLVKLSQYQGKPVLLYFYPHDDTSGCTKEANNLKDSFDKYKAKGAIILGVSRQDEKSHQQFKNKYQLPFDLLADSDGVVGKLYGIGQMPIFGTFQRQSVLIGPDRKVIHFYYDVDPSTHAAEVLRDLSSVKSGL